MHIPLQDPIDIVLTGKTFLKGSELGLTLKLMSILKDSFLLQKTIPLASFQLSISSTLRTKAFQRNTDFFFFFFLVF